MIWTVIFGKNSQLTTISPQSWPVGIKHMGASRRDGSLQGRDAVFGGQDERQKGSKRLAGHGKRLHEKRNEAAISPARSMLRFRDGHLCEAGLERGAPQCLWTVTRLWRSVLRLHHPAGRGPRCRVQEWLRASRSSNVRMSPLQADFGPSDDVTCSKSLHSKEIPGRNPTASGRFAPLLVLLVVSRPQSCEASFGRLDPFKSSKFFFSKGIPTRQFHSPGVEVPCSFSLLSAAPTGICRISTPEAGQPHRPQSPPCLGGHFLGVF